MSQMQLDNVPKKRGRPKKEGALTPAERAKRARDKKKALAKITINSTIGDTQSARYEHLKSLGLSLNDIVDIAYSVVRDVVDSPERGHEDFVVGSKTLAGSLVTSLLKQK